MEPRMIIHFIGKSLVLTWLWMRSGNLDEIRKKVYDYKEHILCENKKLTVNALREKWFRRR